MKLIQENIINEIEIEKSKFICLLIKINSTDDVVKELDKIKQEYTGATHYCYAYIIENLKKCSDDKEPSNTAGLPILNVLEQKNVTNILCVVVRYFGGIKLGTGGLVRAYTKSVTEAFKLTVLKEIISGKKICIEFNYENTKNIEYILNKVKIISKEFNNTVCYIVEISNNEYELLFDKLKQYSINIKVIEDIIL
jgi:uncharacterized YigZ family protein